MNIVQSVKKSFAKVRLFSKIIDRFNITHYHIAKTAKKNNIEVI